MVGSLVISVLFNEVPASERKFAGNIHQNCSSEGINPGGGGVRPGASSVTLLKLFSEDARFMIKQLISEYLCNLAPRFDAHI